MKWIDVNESLPKPDHIVLTTDSDDDLVLGFIYNGRWVNLELFDIDPSHWIEIADVPKPKIKQ